MANVCLPLVAVLLFPVPSKTSPAQSKRFQEAVSSAAFCEVLHRGERARWYIWDIQKLVTLMSSFTVLLHNTFLKKKRKRKPNFS